jgi:hypothetical protein
VSARASRPADINASDRVFRFQANVPVTTPAATNDRRSHESGPDLSLFEVLDTLLALIARNPEWTFTYRIISISIGDGQLARVASGR